jgi:hypothetical protein
MRNVQEAALSYLDWLDFITLVASVPWSGEC